MKEEIRKVLVDEIKNLSIKYSDDKITVNRREFVDYINEIYPDFKLIESITINEIVREVFEECSYNTSLQQSISNCFLHDDGINKLYDSERIQLIPKTLSIEKNEQIFEKINFVFEMLENVCLEMANQDILAEMAVYDSDMNSIKLIDVFSLTGASKVGEKMQEATKVYLHYKGLIDHYEAIKFELSLIFQDFEQIRNILKYLREDLAHMLIEVFGENFKISHPELFAFSDVKYIETSALLNRLEIEFRNIEQNSKIYFDVHKQIYDSLGNLTINSLENVNGRKGALTNAVIDVGIEAAISIFKTREQAKNTIAKLEHDIQFMKKSFWVDNKSIKLDIMRLLEIFKNVKEHLLPVLKQFTSKFISVFEDEIKPNFSLILKLPEIPEIKNRNIVIQNRLKQIELEIQDLENVTEDAKNWIEIYALNVNNLKKENKYFLKNRPARPTLFQNFFSVGLAHKIFVKMEDEWIGKTHNTRTNFTNNNNFLKLEGQRLKLHESELERLKTEQLNLKQNLKDNSSLICEKLQKENEIKTKIGATIDKIVSLSTLSKSILEVRLDDRLLEVKFP